MKIPVRISLFLFALVFAASAADTKSTDQAVETSIQSLIPDVERYIRSGMKAFDVPGLAIGINTSFDKAVLRPEGDALIIELQATGAEFRLEPCNGDVLAVRLVSSGRFAAVAKNLGDEPNGLAQFQADAAGKPVVLHHPR